MDESWNGLTQICSSIRLYPLSEGRLVAEVHSWLNVMDESVEFIFLT